MGKYTVREAVSGGEPEPLTGMEATQTTVYVDADACPVTRIVESRKAYNRAGARKECREFSAEAGS